LCTECFQEIHVAAQYEYLVCQTQQGYTTFENDQWLGKVAIDDDANGAHTSCPRVWQYLNDRGLQGWELVGAATLSTTQGKWVHETTNQLFLKRLKP
jgi:hypothetical protein